MIKLSVEEYCWNCDGFEPVVDKYKSIYESEGSTTTITCENKNRCRAIYRFIKKQFEKEQNDGTN